jgi:hypothetical protein
MCEHLFRWSVQTQSSMAAPVKITAFKEASIAIEREATFFRQAPLSSRVVLFWFRFRTPLFDFPPLPVHLSPARHSPQLS